MVKLVIHSLAFLLGTSVQLLVNANIYKEPVTSYLLIYDVTGKLLHFF